MVDKAKFISEVLPGALDGYEKYNILPSLTIAQAILESDWGQRHVGNNLFGIKATSSWRGSRVKSFTTEYINGNPRRVEAYFRAYDSFTDSIKDHNELLGLSKRYEIVRQAEDYKEASYAVWRAGYATDPKYPEKLIKIIEEYKLMEYDRKVHWAEEHFKSLEAKGIIIYEKRFDDYMKRGEVFALLDRALSKEVLINIGK
jgi:flagellum-specific peptidoglycan hydrolase FlgJ